MSTAPILSIRRAEPDELVRVVELCRIALGWQPGDPNEAFFRWKHLENPFGASPIWIAEDGGRLAGVRAMMRWRFRRGDARLHAVRAVDTATHPDFQGRGVFSALTRRAVEELRTEGVNFVFNTPNDKSRPGYLKLGWYEAGRVAIAGRPLSVGGARRMATARVAAAKWSESETFGTTARLADRSSSLWTTDTSETYLAWRYGFEPLHYRAVSSDNGWAEAVARVRRRGGARELALVDVASADGESAHRAVRALLDVAPADYAVATRTTPGTGGFMPLPTLGPRLVLRGLATNPPAPADLDLRLADIELF